MVVSDRLTAVAAESSARRSKERRALRVLALLLALLVVVPSATANPGASVHGTGLAITVCLVVLITGLAVVLVRGDRLDRHRGSLWPTVVALVAMTLAGAVLCWKQPAGTGELALAIVAWVVGARLSFCTGVLFVCGAGVVTAVGIAAGGGHTTTATTTTLLLAALLFLVSHLYRRAEIDRERAEIATAALADAKEREVQSAALAERSRIARDLHDVLAHSLSGLTLQLEAVRMTAIREQASESLLAMLERCRSLANEGLAEAKQAVRALRGENVPGVADLGRLVDGWRLDGLHVELVESGTPRAVPPEVGMAVFRAAQEALTNVGRHAGATEVTVELAWLAGGLRLVVTDAGCVADPPAALADVGSGFGLDAMRERAELLGGTLHAGPHGAGFRVELELPV